MSTQRPAEVINVEFKKFPQQDGDATYKSPSIAFDRAESYLMVADKSVSSYSANSVLYFNELETGLLKSGSTIWLAD